MTNKLTDFFKGFRKYPDPYAPVARKKPPPKQRTTFFGTAVKYKRYNAKENYNENIYNIVKTDAEKPK